MPSLSFALNAHGPWFERYGLLCVASIRHWCGEGVGIQVYEPSNLPPCTPEARAFFQRHGAEMRSFHNPFLPDLVTNLKQVPARHLTYNKLFTLLDVHPGEQRVFLDADQVLLGDPTQILLAQQAPAGVVAADTPEWFLGNWDELSRDMGLAPTKRRITLWSTYSYGNQPEPPTIQSHPAFCSGLVSVTSTSLLPAIWLEYAGRLEAQIHTVARSFFVDQISLSLAAEASGQAWDLLPRRCSATPQVFRFIDSPLLFHYCNFDALAAQAARTPALHHHLRVLCDQLLRETGLDLRFQLLTQWPRWGRRMMGIVRSRLDRLGVPLPLEPMRQ